jgi:hypothetical protein
VEVFSSCANNITDKVLFPIIASDRPMVHVYRKGKKERKVVVLGLKSKACVYRRRKGLMAADVEERKRSGKE